MNLIDKDGLLLLINKELAFGGLSSKALKRIVQRYPAERNAQVVIRCKDCKYWRENTQFCAMFSGVCTAIRMPPNGYCSEAERKEQ